MVNGVAEDVGDKSAKVVSLDKSVERLLNLQAQMTINTEYDQLGLIGSFLDLLDRQAVRQGNRRTKELEAYPRRIHRNKLLICNVHQGRDGKSQGFAEAFQDGNCKILFTGFHARQILIGNPGL